MNDYNRETTDYEPNFIMKDAPEETVLQGAEVPEPSVTEPVIGSQEVSAESVSAASSDDPSPTASPLADDETAVRDFIDLDYTQTYDRPEEPVAGKAAAEAANTDTAYIGVPPKRPEDTAVIGRPPENPENTAVIGRPPENPEDTTVIGRPPVQGNGSDFAANAASEQSGPHAQEAQRPHVFARPRKADVDETMAGTPYGGGAFRDPRANFGSRGSAYASADPERGNVYNNFQSSHDDGPDYEPTPKAVKKQKKPAQPITLTRRSLALLVILLMLVAAVFGAGTSILANTLLDNGGQTAKTEKTPESSAYTLEDATGSSMSIAEITAKTKDSVVEIRTESVSSDSWMQQYVTEGAGSGVIISADGYIMTNNHVIENARKITVTTSDSKEYQATLVGTDSTNDVAVIKVDAEGLTAATYGNSDQLQVGDLAVAIGNPLGELGGTVTSGIISALDRELSIDGKTMRLLQTDSSINPGNSGGGLFNDDGQLIGIVVAKSSGSGVEGLGFAIPINTAASVAEQLMDKGYVSGQPFTGMAYQESSDSQEDMGGFGQFFGGGEASTNVYIAEVNGANAKKAGFQPGDMVYAIDGKVITTFDELSSIITSKKPGDKVTYTIVRDGMTMDISFELEEKTN